MFNKRPDNSSIGTVKKNSNPDTMTNAEILQAIEIMMDAPEEEMNTDRIEEYLSILQSRAPVTEEYDSEVQWAKLEEAHPLAFEDSSQLEEMAPSFPARKEKLHHVRHIHMLTRGAGVAAAVIVLSTVTANALGFHPIHAILQWAEGIVQVCINPSGTMELPNSTPSEYHSLAEALEQNGIDATGLPTWIPQDYSIYSITSKVSDGIVKCVAEFESNRGDLMMRVTSYAIENTIAVEERDESSR